MNQVEVTWFAGVTGATFSYFFGGWNGLLELFLLAIIVDYITGIAASFKEGTGLNSEVGWWGLMKKSLMIIAIGFAHRADIALGLDILMYGTLYAFLANELISIVENYGRLGLPLPDQFKKMIDILKNRGGSKDANHPKGQ